MQQFSFIAVNTIITKALNETLGSSTPTQSALLNPALIQELNRINREFVRAPSTKGDNDHWSWMGQEEKIFPTFNATALDGAIAASAATFDVDSASNFPSSGRVWIETSKDAVDIVDFESVASSTVTVSTTSGDETVDIAHDDAAHVELLYALPSDFAQVVELFVDSIEYFSSKTGQLPIGRRYELRGGYILFPRDIGTRDVTLRYERGATDLDTGNESADLLLATQIPEDFMDYPVFKLMAYIQRNRRKSDWTTYLQLAENALDEALTYDLNYSDNYIYAD